MNYLYLYAFVTVALLAFAAIIIKVEKMSEMTYEQTQFYNMIKEKLAYKEYKDNQFQGSL